jgi:D-glycero-D-manno-heptose 1,7-bisphosphate phosphatase
MASLSAGRWALFLDRDGVINADFGYVHRVDQIVFLEGIFDLCRAARVQGYAIVVITNQAGIGRGLYSEADFQTLMAWMTGAFSREGAPVDGVYHCPHHPEHGLGAYRVHCACRKPEPGMLLEAQRDLSLDLARSILIGDKMHDIEAARRAGVGRRVLLADEGPLLAGPDEICVPDIASARALLFGRGGSEMG